MRRSLLIAVSSSCFTFLSTAGCDSPGDPGVSTNHTNLTLHLDANTAGDLEICGDDARFTDPNAAAELGDPANHALADTQCQQLPNPGGCASAEVDVNSETGVTSCFRCLDSSGAVSDERCDDNPVVCTVFAAPDPDCAVCAILDGAVVFSSCVPTGPDPTRCELLTDGCETCFADDGDTVSTTCDPHCDTVLCAQAPCLAGTRAEIRPGDCCPSCVPVNDCSGAACPELAPIDCPPGQVMRRIPDDCCGYYCEPDDCSTYVGGGAGDPTGSRGSSTGTAVVPCPPGTTWIIEPPTCGQCVPTEPDRYCAADSDCGTGERCIYDAGVCQLPPECVYQACPDVCFGVCLPVCGSPVTGGAGSTGTDPDYIPPAYCEGDLITEVGPDGCPFTSCLCPNGDLSLDGTCGGLDCSLVMCPAVECPPGTSADFTNSCCGNCVPLGCGSVCPDPTDPNVTYMSNDPNICPLLDYTCAADQAPFANECGCGCLTRLDPTGTPDGSSGISSAPPPTCPQILCAPGWHIEADPAGCCEICVPDLCTSSADCAPSDYCTTEDGVCDAGPCADPNGSGCTGLTVCYGTCAPRSTCRDPTGVDPSTAETVTSIDGAGNATSAADACDPDGRTVIEVICLADGTLWESAFACPNGCESGACVP